MKEEFIPYKQSLELKKLNFDEECFSWWLNTKDIQFGNTGNIGINTCNLIEANLTGVVLAPLYQQAFRWFREKHNIEMSSPIKRSKDLGLFYGGFIVKQNEAFGESYGSNFKTYEEAQLGCLKKLIEIVKNK